MSRIKVIDKVATKVGGQRVPALEFVRRYKTVAAAISKATATTDPVQRDAKGDRKLGAPDFATMSNIHRTISRRNRDAKMTLQMLPDLKLALEMIISLIMSPKDMYSDDISILSNASDLLPATTVSALNGAMSKYFKTKHDLSEFAQQMLMEVLGEQGSLPVAIIPENSLDDLINNYNTNISVESFKKNFDISTNTPYPIKLLGVPDYLLPAANKNTPGRIKLGSEVHFDLQAFDTTRRLSNTPTINNAYIEFSKLSEDKKGEPWHYQVDTQSFDIDRMVCVTDNMNVLNLPHMAKASQGQRVQEALSNGGFGKMEATLESMKSEWDKEQRRKLLNGEDRQLSDLETEQLLFKHRRFAHTPVAALRTQVQLKRNSVGEPMRRIFDSACFLVMSEQGNPTNKLGGYVMMDEMGNPLTSQMHENSELMDLSMTAGGNGNFVSSMNERSSQMLNGKSCDGMNGHALRAFMTRATEQLAIKDLVDRVKNGQYTNGVELASNDDFYWLMASRLLKGQRTQLLWIPKEYLVYFAVDYDEFGFGKSLLDDIRNITSMRIMLMVSGIAASLKNSIGRTKVTVKLDEEDADANKTLEDIQDEILKSRMNPIPFGINNVADISKYLQRSCYEFEISGSTAIPDMQIGFDQFQTNYPMPDNELKEQLKDLSIQHFGLTRDAIDAAGSADFAIQAATSNMLTQKRILRLQRKIAPLMGRYVQIYAANSEELQTEIRGILKNNFKNMQVAKVKKFFNIKDNKIMRTLGFKKLVVEQCISVYVNNLYCEFPSPASTTLEAQKMAFEAQAEFYKDALEYILNESYFDTALQGEKLTEHVDMLKNLYLSHFMRDYMAKNNVLPELAEITTIGDDGRIGLNVLDSLEKHLKALGMTTANFMTRFKQYAINLNGQLEDVPDSSTSGVTDTGGGSSSGGGMGGGGDDSGDDEFGDMDFGDELDAETETTETSETTSTTGGDQPA